MADFQHRIELEMLRMYGCPLDGVDSRLFGAELMTKLIPRLAFLNKHECGPFNVVVFRSRGLQQAYVC